LKSAFELRWFFSHLQRLSCLCLIFALFLACTTYAHGAQCITQSSAFGFLCLWRALNFPNFPRFVSAEFQRSKHGCNWLMPTQVVKVLQCSIYVTLLKHLNVLATYEN
jgi:hypothetical protein